ncbi:hypothetical protein [Amphibiibacter pelophylacis]|uniref:Uncharacterized protein n=1 Tax=Amphibiibacter pelophylacis TaxID=1799477 RepID=A0ACC6P0W5_9BURK
MAPVPPQASRRRLLGAMGTALAAASVAALPGCGFAPRTAPRLAFSRLGILGRAASPQFVMLLAGELSPAADIVTPPWRAQLCLWIIDDSSTAAASYSDANALVRNIQQTLSLRYALTLPPTEAQWRADQDRLQTQGPAAEGETPAHGRVLWTPVTLQTQRDLGYSETRALASELAQADLLGALRADVARSVALRLGTLAEVPAV